MDVRRIEVTGNHYGYLNMSSNHLDSNSFALLVLELQPLFLFRVIENPPEAFAEAGIGQDLVTPQQRVQQSTPPKQTPVGKVVDTARQAAKWLAGRGGPGQEGPTYEEAELDEQQTD